MAATMAAVFTRSWPITGEHCRHVTRRRALIGHLGVVPPQPRHLPGCERRHDRGRGAAAEPGEEPAQPAQQHQPALPPEGEALARDIHKLRDPPNPSCQCVVQPMAVQDKIT